MPAETITTPKITRQMRFAMTVAAHRERHALCPVLTGKGGKLHAAAEQALLDALERRGLIEYLGDRAVPVLSEAGLQTVNAFLATLRPPPEVETAVRRAIG